VAWPESSLPVDSCGLVDVLPLLLLSSLLLLESLLLEPLLLESLLLEPLLLVAVLLVAWSAAWAAIPMPIEPASPAAINDAVSTDVRRRPWSRFIRRLHVG
jgi:hypothetical protein